MCSTVVEKVTLIVSFNMHWIKERLFCIVDSSRRTAGEIGHATSSHLSNISVLFEGCEIRLLVTQD